MSSSGGHSKEFFELIKAIGETKSKHEEDVIIRKEVSGLRVKMKAKGITNKKMKEYVIRMLYCEMLGHECEFGYINAIKLTSSTSVIEKKTGFLAVQLCLPKNSDLLLLNISTIQNDLQSSNYLFVCCALDAVTKLVNVETMPALLPHVINLLNHNLPIVKKKAVMALHALYTMAPHALPKINTYVRQALRVDNLSVIGSAIDLLYILAKEDPSTQKDLVPSLVSILRQIIDHKLPMDYEYHKIPAPWIQMRLIKLLAVLGKDDKAASEQMYDVLKEAMRRAEGVPQIGNAIIYECCRTIASIYSNTQMLELAASYTSKFITSNNSNLKYLGIKNLALIVKVNDKYAAAHAAEVLSCLEGNDETLQRITLELLYKMTNPDNSAVVIDKLFKFMKTTTDIYVRRELATQISELAYQYAPDRFWYIECMTKLLLRSSKYMDPKILQTIIVDVIGTNGDDESSDIEFREHCVNTFYDLVLDNHNLPDQFVKLIAFVLGEYGHLSEHSSEEIMEALVDLMERQYEEEDTKSWIISAMMKLVAQGAQCPKGILEKYQDSKNVDIQQRCYEFIELLKEPSLFQSVLPKNGSFTDVEFDDDLSFLDTYVEAARLAGARDYVDEEQRAKFFAQATEKRPQIKIEIKPKTTTSVRDLRQEAPRSVADYTEDYAKVTDLAGLKGVKRFWGDDEESEQQKETGEQEDSSKVGTSGTSEEWKNIYADTRTNIELPKRDEDRPKLSYENQKLAESLFGKKKRRMSKKTRKRSIKGRSASQKEEQKQKTSQQIEETPMDKLLEDPFGMTAIEPTTQQEEKKETTEGQQQIQLDQLMEDAPPQQKEVPMSKMLSLDELFGNVSISEKKEKQPAMQAEPSSLFSFDKLEPMQPMQPSKQQDVGLSSLISPSTQTLSTKQAYSSPFALSEYPRSHNTPQLACSDAYLQVHYYKVFMEDSITIVYFLSTTTGFNINNIAVNFAPPTKYNLELKGSPTPQLMQNRAMYKKLEPGETIVLNCVLKPIDSQFGSNLIGQINYSDDKRESKLLPFNTSLGMPDLLRLKNMSTEMFGRNWQRLNKEKKIVVNTSVNSCDALSEIFKSINIQTISIIKSEIIAAAEIVNLKSIILVHGNVKQNAVVITVRSESLGLSDKMCRALQKCLT